jgi:hypothetical protein
VQQVRRALLAVIVVVVSGLGFAAPAAAAGPPAQPQVSGKATAWECPADALGCLFSGVNGTGDRYVIRRGCPNGWTERMDLPNGWWDKAFSMKANPGYRYTVFNYTGAGGEYETSGDDWTNGPGERNISYGYRGRVDGIFYGCF